MEETAPKGLTLTELLSPFRRIRPTSQEGKLMIQSLAEAIPAQERTTVAEALKELIHDPGNPDKYAPEGQGVPGAHMLRQYLLWLIFHQE